MWTSKHHSPLLIKSTMAAILRSLSLAYRAPPVIHGSVRSTSTLARFRDILGGEVSAIREAGTFKHERVITTPQAALIKVQERDGYLLNFCANNYLGLSVSKSWFRFGYRIRHINHYPRIPLLIHLVVYSNCSQSMPCVSV